MTNDIQRDQETFLRRMLEQSEEDELLELKEEKDNFSFDDLGRYFSAMSNEANLRGKECAWVILGVDNERSIVGTKWKLHRQQLQQLKSSVTQHTTTRLTFMDIHEIHLSEGRVLMFQIPPAPAGIPVAWKGHWYGRHGESLAPLSLEKLERIRGQIQDRDWSRQVCEGATIADLDEGAVSRARAEFKRKNPKFAEEADDWDLVTFLNKAKLTIDGRITNTAIVLLGRAEAEHFLSPSVAKISWVLREEDGHDKDYEHFQPPFLLCVEHLFSRIRNLRYRYLPDGTLFPMEVMKYDPWVIREALHNCVAHQDYELGGRITVLEMPDELTFTNKGSFLPGSIEAVIEKDFVPPVYRNRFLSDAMVNLNMIDTIGSGIKNMFKKQKDRLFPLPDYDLSADTVTVRILGKILDEKYMRILVEHAGLDLGTTILLDRIQKGIGITKDQHRDLKARGLVEGRYPNLFLCSAIASATDERAKYIKLRGFRDDYYQKLIIRYLEKYGSARRSDIDDLIMEQLPGFLTERQKRTKVNNLLSRMRRLGIVRNIGSRRASKWVLNFI